ncbi:MAG: hypothetical protein O3A78_01085 [Nitrospinae bacterium]|jgi:hypothetical protein|nr:hypothetical protein [Nitrospinota bacterium]
MNDQNLDHIDDEELLSLFYATEKLLQSNNNIADPSALRKIESIKKKLFILEQEMKLRSLWESEEEE